MSGIQVIEGRIAESMQARLPDRRVKQQRKLSLLVAALLLRRDVNLIELGPVLPLESDTPQSRYQWIKRVLRNDLIVPSSARTMPAEARGHQCKPGSSASHGDESVLPGSGRSPELAACRRTYR